MTKKSIKTAVLAFALIGPVASMTSCNRGYGCPQNFEVNQEVDQDVEETKTIFTKVARTAE